MSTCTLHADTGTLDPDVLNLAWQSLGPVRRVECALQHLPENAVLSSSFGMQAALMLHLVTQVRPEMPIVFIDTGYHFAETYRFVDQLSERLNLNLKVFRSETSPAWQEARHGKRWEQGLSGIQSYNHENKVEPMQRALRELDASTWFSGLRRGQSSTRAGVNFVERQWQCYKVHPVADWSDRDVHQYLRRHDLPYHPLREKGYLSIGDWHTTRSVHEVGDDTEQLRFFGLARECGLHQVGS